MPGSQWLYKRPARSLDGTCRSSRSRSHHEDESDLNWLWLTDLCRTSRSNNALLRIEHQFHFHVPFTNPGHQHFSAVEVFHVGNWLQADDSGPAWRSRPGPPHPVRGRPPSDGPLSAPLLTRLYRPRLIGRVCGRSERENWLMMSLLNIPGLQLGQELRTAWDSKDNSGSA